MDHGEEEERRTNDGPNGSVGSAPGVGEVQDDAPPTLPEGLRHFIEGKRTAPPQGRCELCGVALAHEHSHLVERDDLQIPVGMAFFFYNAALARSVAFYPGPAGATESLLALDSSEAMRETNPLFASIEDDVEALLVRNTGDAFGREFFDRIRARP